MTNEVTAAGTQSATPRTDAISAICLCGERMCRSDNAQEIIDTLERELAEARAALSAHRQPVGGEAAEVVKAILAYWQADEDGVVVTVSRQACHEAAALIEALAREDANVKHDIEKLLDWLSEEASTRIKAESERDALNRRVSELSDRCSEYVTKLVAAEQAIDALQRKNTLLEEENDGFRRRLDAPLPEVESQVISDQQVEIFGEYVPADYARDLYRKWQEALELTEAAQTRLGKAQLDLQSAESRLAEAEERPCTHEWYQGMCVHCERSAKDFRAALRATGDGEA